MTYRWSSTDFNEQVGQRVQQFRKAAGLSQGGLAAELTARGISFQQQTVLKVEKGSRPLKLDEAFVMASVLDVAVADLCSVAGFRNAPRDVVDRMHAARQRANASGEMGRKIEREIFEMKRRLEELTEENEASMAEYLKLREQATGFGVSDQENG